MVYPSTGLVTCSIIHLSSWSSFWGPLHNKENLTLSGRNQIQGKVTNAQTGKSIEISDYLELLSSEGKHSARALLESALRQREANYKWLQEQLVDTLIVPEILYKYIPCSHLKKGAPLSLRATQLAALNDVMECNVTTMKYPGQNENQWLEALQRELKDSIGKSLSTEELGRRRRTYGDPRISTVIQEFLNPLLGVVSFSSDPLVNTMWSHYAENSGFVIGYNTEVLRTLGFELRKMLYLEYAPRYNPLDGNVITISFDDEDYRRQRELEGAEPVEAPVPLEPVPFLELKSDWKKVARLLFVKGKSWEYEKEVRLLVDQKDTRSLDKQDKNGHPVSVLDIPVEVIDEVYAGFDTPPEDIERISKVVGTGNHRWKMKRTSSHAFRMKVTLTSINN